MKKWNEGSTCEEPKRATDLGGKVEKTFKFEVNWNPMKIGGKGGVI